jgi:hypothetical protein
MSEIPLGIRRFLQREKSGHPAVKDRHEIFLLKINKITCLGELEGFANRRRILYEQGCNAWILPAWNADELDAIRKRKYQLEQDQKK